MDNTVQQTGRKPANFPKPGRKETIMSVERIREKADEARRVLGEAAAQAAQARTRVKKELEGLDKEVKNVQRGGLVALRAIQDDADMLNEELEQYDEIFGETPPQPPIVARDDIPSSDADEPPAPPAPPEPPVPDPEPPTAPQPPVPPAPPTTQVNVFVRFIRWVRGFTALQWILALIGLIVALVVASNTWESILGDIPRGGLAESWVASAWWVGLSFLGFGLGGLIGTAIENRDE